MYINYMVVKSKTIELFNYIIDNHTSKILKYQNPAGWFPATGQDEYETYSLYVWGRDSSLAVLGLIWKLKSASKEDYEILTDAIERNFKWWFNRINDEKDILKYLISTDSISVAEFHEKALPARFTKEGKREKKSECSDENWPNVQLDGYGTLLAVFGEYIKHTNKTNLVLEYKDEISILASYLSKFATFPNCDMWEDTRFLGENGCLHVSTLACVYAGISAVDEMNINSVPNQKTNLSSLKLFVEDNFINSQGELVKYVQRNVDGIYSIPEDPVNHLDSSMFFLSFPFECSMYSPDNPLMKNISERVERDLNKNGGVKRYPGDEFYGGGLWPMLSALQGIYLLFEGNICEALRNYEWILQTQDVNFNLIEQVPNLDSEACGAWCKMWGEPTSPLLMGHGITIVFIEELKRFLEINDSEMQSFLAITESYLT